MKTKLHLFGPVLYIFYSDFASLLTHWPYTGRHSIRVSASKQLKLVSTTTDFWLNISNFQNTENPQAYFRNNKKCILHSHEFKWQSLDFIKSQNYTMIYQGRAPWSVLQAQLQNASVC